ncbi:MAG: T9SS type A sorting domain-containing protein [Muribaculaceae bacterium]|nr:T9SS type A sorting domain-containing protein [Muribaculaceae bacterium]
MKKIFTSLFLMATALVATAQNFTVTAFGGSKTLKDGDVIECGYEEGLFGNAWDPAIIVTCNKNLTLTVTADAEKPAEGAVQFCGLTGQCQRLNGTPETRSNVYNTGDKVPMQLDIVNGNVVEPVNATLKITDGQETVNITVTFVGEPQEELAISSVSAKGVQISATGRTLRFVADNATDITLYTISGQSAVSRRISGTGSLNLSHLPAGVYIYRAGNKTGKIILR